jgi:HEAT repeat protein
MGLPQTLLAILFLAFGTSEIDRYPISYLIQRKKVTEAVDLYNEWRKKLGRHDFEVLEQMAMLLLDEGARSEDPEKQLLSIYGSGIAGISSPIDILEAGILSQQPETQLAAIQALARLQDDRSEELLCKAMASNFLQARMEAAFALAARKARTAVGQIEALMYKLPPAMHYYFPEFFALIGTNEAILALRHLMDDRQTHVKVEAILSAAHYERDDLLPLIRANITHSNPAEQEACAFAIGKLKDSKSIDKLKKLTHSPQIQVRLAACRSLYQLGDARAQEQVEAMALEENPFAILLLSEMPGSEKTLATLLSSSSEQIRANAAIALLKLRDPRCIDTLLGILIRDGRDLGIEPHFSVGNSLMAWRITPLAKQKVVGEMYDLQALSLSIREHLLRDCLELPEADFLKIARTIFYSRQNELIPSLTTLLQNLQTKEAVELLQARAQTAGAPLVRTYCSLALFRMQEAGPYAEHLRSWIRSCQDRELIRFRPILLRQRHLDGSSFELTPQESSRLLIEAYAALAELHEPESIDLLLEGIKAGHPKNRYVLAGLLLQAIQ